MTEITTNRDLYCFITHLVKHRKGSLITLQAYLENLRRLVRPIGGHEALALRDFAELLQAAFEAAPARAASCASSTDGYSAWEQRLDEQIRDLREMREAGTLDDEYRCFGVDAPRGGRWYNFDPCAYLECAAAGALGGWREGDDAERCYVPGPVAVIDAAGTMTSVDPRDIDDPVVELQVITWEAFVDFLDAGQCYE